MNWMTIAWPMVAAVCLTLGMIELRVGLTRPIDTPRLLFSVSAVATAVGCALELALMRAENPAEFMTILRWGELVTGFMMTLPVAFIWFYFRPGNKWLALAGPCLFALALIVNFLHGSSLTYRQITSIKAIESFGGVSYRVAVGTPNPWNLVSYLGALVILLFVIDAARRLAIRGNRKRATIVGGSVALWLLIAFTQSALVDTGVLRMPYIYSVCYLIIVLAMSYELTSDVSAAVQTGRKLQASEKRLDLASAAAGIGMWSVDPVNNEDWASAKAYSLLGLSESEPFTLARFIEAVHPDDRETVERAVTRSMTDGHDCDVEHRVQVDGEARWLAVRGRVELNAAGKPALVRGLLLDISARRRSEMELQRLQGQLAHTSRVSMMGQLATALAHELHQPLGAILRNAEAAELFLEHDPPDHDELRAILADIRADDRRAREVIDRLRALLKRRNIESLVLSVGDLLSNIDMLTRADAAARSIAVEIDSGSELPRIMGDAVHLQQVLLNLVLNAMDAIEGARSSKSLVCVRAEYRGGEEVEVQVSDTGPGLASTDWGRLFEPFFTTKASGMGIGLSISRTIIEAHGGRIWAENNKTEGATFRFTLPIQHKAVS